ncbi:MAG: RHS repeat domain-containing protein [Asticcacaulis sp.]
MGRVITSATDENGKTTNYEYSDPYNGKLTKVTYPEGNYSKFTYDDRGNLTEHRDVAKPGSGIADSVWTAGYDTTCANYVTCNQPNWVRDPNGNTSPNTSNPADETDYTYDPVHGGVLTETDPADAAGVRPQTRNTYTALYAKVLNSSGVPVNAEAPIYRLTRTSTCRTATTANPAACVGTANETVTTYTYNNNLLLASVTVAAGDNSITATTSYGYDDYGNRIWVDGPRTDVDDKSYTTYDLLRRPVYEISADPDGALSLKRTIVHHIYDVDGHEVRTETGSGNATDGSDFVMATYTAVTYDSYGNAVKTVVGQP